VLSARGALLAARAQARAGRVARRDAERHSGVRSGAGCAALAARAGEDQGGRAHPEVVEAQRPGPRSSAGALPGRRGTLGGRPVARPALRSIVGLRWRPRHPNRCDACCERRAGTARHCRGRRKASRPCPFALPRYQSWASSRHRCGARVWHAQGLCPTRVSCQACALRLRQGRASSALCADLRA